MHSPFIVGITGCSGSGKTYILQSILQQLSEEQVSVLSQDNYYIPREEQPIDKNGVRNFDLPESIHLKDFSEDIRKIKSGQTLERQEYTYNNPAKISATIKTNPAPVVLVEGIFVFSHEFIDKELDYRVYIEADSRVRLQRRLQRDYVERGYDADDVNYRFINHVMPTYKKYIEPFRSRADLIINNNSAITPDLGDLIALLKTKSA